MTMDKSCTLLVHFDKGTPALANEIKEALEGNDVEAKVDALKKAIMLLLNGETIPNSSSPSSVMCFLLKTTLFRNFSFSIWRSLRKLIRDAKVVGKINYAGNLPGYDEYVPMVDRAVDASWKSPASLQRPYTSKG
ncbi:hypothetical protein K1719_004757 [Acacia pycnantha]|nr:hypothetical protein K1719_004757 [Acacia pycnantha]